jgi:hypothetical protein
MSKKLIISSAVLFTLIGNVYGADCKALMSQYNAPDPSIKTMKQLKRWCKRKVKDSNKAALEKCLIDRAADNPNKATVAGQ